MKQVPDRKKMRREYLRKKSGAYVRGTIGATLIIPSTVCFCLFALCTLIYLILCLFGFARYISPRMDVMQVLFMALLTTGFGILTRWSWRARHEFRRASEMPVVPPVTPDTLPADEILVRGAEEPPVVQKEALLRAAQMGEEIPKEELLRVSQGEQH